MDLLDILTLGPQSIEIDHEKFKSAVATIENDREKANAEHHLRSLIELEVVKYAWLHDIRPNTGEFTNLRGELDDAGWKKAQKYASYAFSGNFKREDYFFCKPNKVEKRPFTLTSQLDT